MAEYKFDTLKVRAGYNPKITMMRFQYLYIQLHLMKLEMHLDLKESQLEKKMDIFIADYQIQL